MLTVRKVFGRGNILWKIVGLDVGEDIDLLLMTTLALVTLARDKVRVELIGDPRLYHARAVDQRVLC